MDKKTMRHEPIGRSLKPAPSGKEPEPSRMEFDLLADNTTDLIYRFSLEKGFEYMNPSSVTVLGYKPEEHYAAPDLGLKIIHPEDRSKLVKVIEDFQARRQPKQPIEVRWLHKDGHIVVTELMNVPVHDRNGKLVAIEGIARDIAHRKRMEEEIRNRAEALEKDVHERTEELRKLNETITERLVQKIEQINHISQIEESLKTTLDIESGLETILDGVIEDLAVDMAAVFILGRESRLAEIKALKPKIGTYIGKKYSLDSSFLEYECINNNRGMSKIVGESPSILCTKSVHCQPLAIKDEIMGFLALGSMKEETLDESDLSILKFYSRLVSSVLERTKLTVEPSRETVKAEKSRYRLDLGSSYATEDDIDLAYDVFVDRVTSGFEGLCITRVFPKKIRERYALEKTPIVWLSDETAEGQLTINNIQDLSILITTYLKNAEKPVILIDGVEYLVSHQGFEPVYRFLQTKRSQIESTESVLILPFFKDALEPRQAKLIEREFEILTRSPGDRTQSQTHPF